MEILDRFLFFVKEHKLIKTGDSILIGVSGGPDSLTLLDLLDRIKEEYNLTLFVFHLNHQFREEASKEAKFVARQAQKYGLEFILEEYDVPFYARKNNLSPEEAAREVRFKLLFKWAGKKGVQKIALAHHQDDLVETVLLNLFRGSGLKGLTGIRPLVRRNGFGVIHPLLNISRQEIEIYCDHQGFEPRYDPTNQETIYTRNKIRHKVLPYIKKEINPAVSDVIARMAGIIREEEDYLDEQAEDIYQKLLLEKGEKLTLSIDGLRELPRVIRRRVFLKAFRDYKGDAIDLYYDHYQALEDLVLTGETGKIVELKGQIRVRRSYNKLIFERDNNVGNIEDYNIQLKVPGSVKLPDGSIIEARVKPIDNRWRQDAIQQDICLCDLARVELPLKVRNRRPGDRFRPLGMKGEKKLKDFLIDEKVPRLERDQLPLVLDAEGRIIWVAGYRMADDVKVKETTEKLLKLCIIKRKETKYERG